MPTEIFFFMDFVFISVITDIFSKKNTFLFNNKNIFITFIRTCGSIQEYWYLRMMPVLVVLVS